MVVHRFVHFDKKILWKSSRVSEVIFDFFSTKVRYLNMLRQKSPIVNHQFSACFTIFEWPQWPSFWAKSPMISERNSAGLTH